MRSRDPAPPIRADLAPASTLVSTVLTTCAISALLPQLIVLVTGLRISGVEMDSTTNSGCLCSFLSVTWTMTGLIDSKYLLFAILLDMCLWAMSQPEIIGMDIESRTC